MQFDYEDLVELDDDNLGNDIEALTTTFADASTIDYVYTYDLAGNRVQMLVDGSDMFDYGYDPVYQLTSSVLNSNTVAAYNYDNVSGRTQATELGTTRVYTSNWLNQYTGITNPSATLTYDDNGNMTSDGTYTYTYDFDNRMLSSSAGSSYFYDHFGRRTTKTVGSTITYYVYDGDHVIAEYVYNGTGGTVLARKYIYGPGIDQPVAMINVDGENETWYYYHQDALGSVVALSNSNGNLVERYRYTPFGKQSVYNAADTYIGSTSAYGNPYMFTARQYDAETGLYYYRARMYSPTLGRFLQTDPIGYFDSMNLYQYCGNNPLNWVDPTGEGWKDFFVGATKGGAKRHKETRDALGNANDNIDNLTIDEDFDPEMYQKGYRMRRSNQMSKIINPLVGVVEGGLESCIDDVAGIAGDKVSDGISDIVKDRTGFEMPDEIKERISDYISDYLKKYKSE